MEEGNILDPVFQQRLEDARVLLRQEIQKELKIKEAAERMRRAITNRKSAADVDGQLKASRRKLERLHSELQEVNAWAMAPEKESAANATAAAAAGCHHCWNIGNTTHRAAPWLCCFSLFVMLLCLLHKISISKN